MHKRRSEELVTVAAVVSPLERPRVDAAGSGCFTVVHRESVPEATKTVRERNVDAVLVSVHRCEPREIEAVGEFVRRFPAIPAYALVSRHDPQVTETVLRLGVNGVRQVVDVTSPQGWVRLRQLLAQPASRAASRILGPMCDELPLIAQDARLFLEALVRLAPSTPTVRQLARQIGVRPSTLMSRFTRAGLPSPRSYLSAIRLLHASQLFDSGGLSIADVAYRLECSSPQSLGRHLRTTLGITTAEFRRRFPFQVALERFLRAMITPYVEQWGRVHPIQ